VGYRGPATSSVVINRQPPREALEREAPVYLGSIDVVPPADGRIVRGEGRVVYDGRDVGLTTPQARVVFRVPSPTYRSEWELVSGVLQELDAATAAARLEALERDACAPAAAGECAQAVIAPSVARDLADPGRRWTAMRELSRDDRPFARFVRFFSRALLWDGDVDEAERERLKSLLATAAVPE
jgi:hypothetical protein